MSVVVVGNDLHINQILRYSNDNTYSLACFAEGLLR